VVAGSYKHGHCQRSLFAYNTSICSVGGLTFIYLFPHGTTFKMSQDEKYSSVKLIISGDIIDVMHDTYSYVIHKKMI